MYCENCGKKLESSDRFCTGCGTPAHSKNTKHLPNAPTAEEKWWYRLLKVVYILLYVGSIGLVFIISYSTMPYATLDGDLSIIQCDNGERYAPSKNNIYLYSWSKNLSDGDDQDARILCAYHTTNFYSHAAPTYKNYTFYPHFNTPDYGSWVWYSLLALVVVWAVLKLIRLAVQYVALGSRPKWHKEFKKLY